MCIHGCYDTCMEVKGQLTKTSSLLPSHRFQVQVVPWKLAFAHWAFSLVMAMSSALLLVDALRLPFCI